MAVSRGAKLLVARDASHNCCHFKTTVRLDVVVGRWASRRRRVLRGAGQSQVSRTVGAKRRRASHWRVLRHRSAVTEGMMRSDEAMAATNDDEDDDSANGRMSELVLVGGW